MKSIHTTVIFFILFLMSITEIHSQSKDSVPQVKKSKYFFIPTNLDSIKKLNNSLIWTKNYTENKPFSIYNATSETNDLYFINADTIRYIKSNVMIENNFRNNKIDSFNPVGASNLQSGVLLGVFNLLLKK
jgi:hypothetical protein